MANQTNFRKGVLRAGNTFVSPDGEVEVTPERLKHWASNWDAITKAGYALPMHFDHPDDPGDMDPVEAHLLSTIRKMSSAKTHGKVKAFKLAKDGQSAELEVQVTPSAAEKCESDVVFVSPVIKDRWKDGHGTDYEDVITSFDFCDWPVDHSQTPFEPVDDEDLVCCQLRMSLTEGSDTVYKLQVDEDAPPKDDDDTDDEDGQATNDDADKSKAGGGDDAARVKKMQSVITELAKLDVIIPPDTADPDVFLNLLESALMTAAAQQGIAEPGVNDMAGQTQEQDPMIATMSLENKKLKEKLSVGHREDITKRLSLLRDSGRCTPAEFDERAEAVKTVKLSLDKEGEFESTRLEDWITDRESLPEGAVISASGRKKMALTPPSKWTVDPNQAELTPEEVEAASDRLVRKARPRSSVLANT